MNTVPRNPNESSGERTIFFFWNLLKNSIFSTEKKSSLVKRPLGDDAESNPKHKHSVVTWFPDDYVAKRLFQNICVRFGLPCQIEWKKNSGKDASISIDGKDLSVELKISRALSHGGKRWDFNFSAIDLEKFDVAVFFGVLESTRFEPESDAALESIVTANHHIVYDCYDVMHADYLSKVICFIIHKSSSIWTKKEDSSLHKITPSAVFSTTDKYKDVRVWAFDKTKFIKLLRNS